MQTIALVLINKYHTEHIKEIGLLVNLELVFKLSPPVLKTKKMVILVDINDMA